MCVVVWGGGSAGVNSPREIAGVVRDFVSVHPRDFGCSVRDSVTVHQGILGVL